MPKYESVPSDLSVTWYVWFSLRGRAQVGLDGSDRSLPSAD